MDEGGVKRAGSPWLAVAILVAAAGIGAGVLRLMLAGAGPAPVEGNEAEAVRVLASVRTLEELWRKGDADGNGAEDWWAADWSGFHRRLAKNGKPVLMMSGAVAAADAAPLPESATMAAALPRAPHNGYWFRAIPVERGYAFAAFPSEPGVSGRRVFLTREDGVVWGKGSNEVPLSWPAEGPDRMKAVGWSEVARSP